MALFYPHKFLQNSAAWLMDAFPMDDHPQSEVLNQTMALV
jgi:hypothetical protein